MSTLLHHSTNDTQHYPQLPQLLLSGFSNSSLYDAHRPSYDPAVVDHMLNSMSLTGKKGAKILDLAAGTGIMTQILAARKEGYKIIAVEPHAEMRGVLEGKSLKEVNVVEGEALGCERAVRGVLGEEGKVDGVVVAQAFHWFATTEALDSINASLASYGTLSLVWNVGEYNQSAEWVCTTKWETELRNLCLQNRDSMPRYRDKTWQRVWTESEEELKKHWQLPYKDKIWNFKVWLTKEKLWSRLLTLCYVKNLKGQDGEKFRRSFEEILDTAEDMELNENAEMAVHYITHLVWTTKRH